MTEWTRTKETVIKRKEIKGTDIGEKWQSQRQGRQARGDNGVGDRKEKTGLAEGTQKRVTKIEKVAVIKMEATVTGREQSRVGRAKAGRVLESQGIS